MYSRIHRSRLMAERSAYRLRTPVLYPRLIGPGGAAEAAQARVYDDFAKLLQALKNAGMRTL